MNPIASSGNGRKVEPKKSSRAGIFQRLPVWLAACGLLTGCNGSAPWNQTAEWRPAYHPDNVFQYTPVLPYDLKRVAVLPLACDERRTDLQDGCGSLDSILQAELIKTKKFEVIPVSCEVLRSRTGQPTWTGAEILPANLFDSLREVYGCDGILFCQLTAYHAYPPLVVGWRLRLVDVRTRQTLWATDEILDADGQTPPKEPGFDPFFEHYVTENSLKEWSILNSPREFGQYAVARVIATLPAR
jgi:hypothetical protein